MKNKEHKEYLTKIVNRTIQWIGAVPIEDITQKDIADLVTTYLLKIKLPN